MSTTRKTKVLHIDNSTDYTGAFRALNDFIVDQQEKIESVVILPKGSKCIPYLQKNAVKVYELPLLEINKSIKGVVGYLPVLLRNAWLIVRIIRKEKIDVLHSNDLYNLLFYAARFFFGARLPLITHVRLMPSGYNSVLYNFWKKMHLRWSDRLIAVSHAVKQSLKTEAVEVVYDVQLQAERHAPYQVQCTEDRPFRFLYLSNYIPGKGNDLCLKAFVQLLEQNQNATLTFAGGLLGNRKNALFKAQLMEKAKSDKIDHAVFFEDFTEDVEAKMKAYDAVLNFSVSESFSMTCFDALRFGVPLVATDSGGPAELFEHGQSGLLVENKNTEAMSKAMMLIMNDCERRKLFSGNSKLYLSQRIAQNKGFDYLADLMLDLGGQHRQA